MKLINELEKHIGNVNKERLIVIAGHPGSGKTILASSICLAFVYQGLKCLYVSFQEPKEKFLDETAGVGLELEKYEKIGLFRFLKLPVVTDGSSLNQIINIINKEVANYSPRVVAIDSISSMLKTLSADIEIRGYLQNYFYELQKMVKGPVILIAELPFGMETIELGNIEFVSDVFLILKHRITRGLLDELNQEILRSLY